MYEGLIHGNRLLRLQASSRNSNAAMVVVAFIVQQQSAIAQAQANIDEAKKLKGRAFVFRDKKMDEQADALFAQAEGMLATARTLGDECAAKVDQFEKNRKKRVTNRGGSEEKKRSPEYY